MDSLDQPAEPQPAETPPRLALVHSKTVQPPEGGIETARPSTAPRAAAKASAAIYPEATRHLPGNAAPAQLHTLEKRPELAIEAASKRVGDRVQQLYVYAYAILLFGAAMFWAVFSHRTQFRQHSLPAVLQVVGYALALLPAAAAPLLLASKKVSLVKAALMAQLFGYLAGFVTAFGIIVNDFSYFFGSIGVFALFEAGFWFWTRLVLNDVEGLPLTD